MEEKSEVTEAAERIRQQVNAVRKSEQPEKDTAEEAPSLGAMRITVELVAGVLAGGLIGYYLDEWLSTSPIFFIICLLLGVAGGALNIYKLVAASDRQKP